MNRRSFLKSSLKMVAALPFAKSLLPGVEPLGQTLDVSQDELDVVPTLIKVRESIKEKAKTEVGPWNCDLFDGINDCVDIYSAEDIRQLMEDCDCEFKVEIRYEDKLMEYNPIMYKSYGEPVIYGEGPPFYTDWSFKDEQEV